MTRGDVLEVHLVPADPAAVVDVGDVEIAARGIAGRLGPHVVAGRRCTGSARPRRCLKCISDRGLGGQRGGGRRARVGEGGVDDLPGVLGGDQAGGGGDACRVQPVTGMPSCWCWSWPSAGRHGRRWRRRRSASSASGDGDGVVHLLARARRRCPRAGDRNVTTGRVLPAAIGDGGRAPRRRRR